MTKQLDWKAEIAAWRASGMSAREFCEGRGYAAGRLYWWSSQLKRTTRGSAHQNGVALARIVRKEVSSKGAPVVVQVGQARVEVPVNVDRAALQAALEVLVAMHRGAQA
jgi:transposase